MKRLCAALVRLLLSVAAVVSLSVTVVLLLSVAAVAQVGPGTITTVAGTDTAGYSGDGGPAVQARLNRPSSVAVDAKGNVYVADWGNHRIRRMGPDGIITILAGTGDQGYSGDGGPAVQARLSNPRSVAVDPNGNVYIADTSNYRIRRTGPDGIITTIVGTGAPGSSGDGGPAVQAQLNGPRGVAVDASGNVYISDTVNARIRRAGLDGILTTLAGKGAPGYSGDGGPAVQARLNSPKGLTVDANGNVYIADYDNSRIRRVGPDGIITTFAGTGTKGYSGDGGPAVQAQLGSPSGVAVDANGNVYIADYDNNRIRRVGPDGIITTFAGMGTAGYSGDGGPAVQAQLNHPQSLAMGANGNVYIADFDNHCIRRVEGEGVGGLSISLSDSVLTFEDTKVGATSQKTFTILNAGSESLSVTGITAGGQDASQFEVSPTAATIAPGGSQTITVIFTPLSVGSKSASLSIAHNASGSPSSVALSGTGAP